MISNFNGARVVVGLVGLSIQVFFFADLAFDLKTPLIKFFANICDSSYILNKKAEMKKSYYSYLKKLLSDPIIKEVFSPNNDLVKLTNSAILGYSFLTKRTTKTTDPTLWNIIIDTTSSASISNLSIPKPVDAMVSQSPDNGYIH